MVLKKSVNVSGIKDISVRKLNSLKQTSDQILGYKSSLLGPTEVTTQISTTFIVFKK